MLWSWEWTRLVIWVRCRTNLPRLRRSTACSLCSMDFGWISGMRPERRIRAKSSASTSSLFR